MKYKIGDVVRIKEWDTLVDEYGEDAEGDIMCGWIFFIKEMAPLCGKLVHITSVRDGFYWIKEDSGEYNWCDEMFLPVSEEMSIECITPGLFVKYKNGMMRMVMRVGTDLFLCGTDGYKSLNDYRFDLTCDYEPENIIAVYEPKELRMLGRYFDDPSTLKLIWERED